MGKKRVCFFDSYAIWGGGEKWHFTTAQRASHLGYDVFVVTSFNSKLAKKCREEAGPINVKEMHFSKHTYFNPLAQWKLFWFFKKNKIDVLVFNSFLDVRNGSLAAFFAGVPKIILRCGMPILPKMKLSYRLTFAFLTHIIAVSNEIKNLFLDGVPQLVGKKPFSILYNGADFDYYSRLTGSPKYRNCEDVFVIGNHSRFTEQKGHVHFLRCCQILKERGVSFRAILAGEGEEKEELIQMVNTLQLSSVVSFIGFVENIADFMLSVDLILFTSLWEGNSHSLVESMAFSKPIVCFNRSSMKEVVVDGYNGFLIEDLNVEQMASSVEKIILNHSLRREMSLNSRSHGEKFFDYNTNIEKFFNLIEAEDKS